MERENGFYVTLPCNSSVDVYTDNSISDFRVLLPKPLQLQGEWEVAVCEFFYPQTVDNLPEPENYIEIINHETTEKLEFKWIDEVLSQAFDINPDKSIFKTPVYTKLEIESGHYPDIETLVKEINNKMGEMKIDLILRYSNIKKKISFSGIRRYTIKPSKQLCYMLGFIPGTWENTSTINEALRSTDISGGFSHAYIYSDIIQEQFVGHVSAQLLRIVNMKTGEYGGSVILEYDRLQYVPISKKHIESIQIQIKSDQNKCINFSYGKVIIKLHFRPVKTLKGLV